MHVHAGTCCFLVRARHLYAKYEEVENCEGMLAEVLRPDAQAITSSSCRPAAEGSFLQRFLAATAHMTPEERGKYLEEPPPGAPDLDEAHQACLRYILCWCFYCKSAPAR